MSIQQPSLTVLTPTYNRASLLQNAFESLMHQTDTDFEWLVVDDGSTDDTGAVLQSFLDAPDRAFPLQVFRKENGGKHTAINYALPHISAPLTLILDSDDRLTEDAVETVLRTWEPYAGDSGICGMSFQRGNSNGQPIGEFPAEVTRSNHIRFRINGGIGGDCCEVIRTKVLREFPFPEFPGERFLGENYLWVNAALRYDTIYIRKIIYLCTYLDGGLTKSGRAMRLRNPQGGMLTSRVEMHPSICLRQRVKKAILYACYGFAAGMKPRSIRKSSGHPFLVGMCMPLGWVFYRKWSKNE